jgi:hypothetical protein
MGVRGTKMLLYVISCLRLKQRNAYKILVGKSGAKRLLDISSRRWEYNTKMACEVIGNKCEDGILLTQNLC